MRTKRLLFVLVVVLAASATVVSGAPAGVGLADEPCPDANGPNTNTCPVGTVGVPYAIQFKESEGSGCGPGKQTFTVDSGTFPPGLTLATSGHVTGTPTVAGRFKFFVKIAEPQGEPSCAGSWGEKEFTIPINPGTPATPKLIIGPEQSGVPLSTVGAAFSLPMTANLSEPKTWSIVDGSGALPPGLQLGSTDGVISGTPTVAGTYGFTVRAVLNSDSQRSDTKALGITVRDQVTIIAPDLASSTGVSGSEVGVRVSGAFTATGGTGTFTWSAAGVLPPGVLFDAATGTLDGRPTSAGRYPFVVTATDSEGRVATYNVSLTVAPRLAFVVPRIPAAQVGLYFQLRLRSIGGFGPMSWRIQRGPLPRGISFDRETATFFGTPGRARTYRIGVEVVDALGVKVTKTLVLVIRAAKKPAKRTG